MKTLGLILLQWNCFGIGTGTEHGWYGPFPFFFFFMFVFMLVFMFFAFRGWRRRSHSSYWPGWSDDHYYEKSDAKNILKNRYAKGEISKEEYDIMKNDI